MVLLQAELLSTPPIRLRANRSILDPAEFARLSEERAQSGPHYGCGLGMHDSRGVDADGACHAQARDGRRL